MFTTFLNRKKESQNPPTSPSHTLQVSGLGENERKSHGDSYSRPISSLGSTKSKISKIESDMVRGLSLRSIAILFILSLALFPVALDITVISTAIPEITNEFHTLSDGSWYIVSYILTATALQPTWGKVYQIFNAKRTFIFLLVIYFIGSLLSAIAPNSAIFILGRSIAGSGSSGILSGLFVITAYVVPLDRRAIYSAIFGSIIGISMFVGPVIGGAFTDKITWRWCFYLSLPLTAVAIAFIILIVQTPDPIKEKGNKSFLQRLNELDWIGPLFFTPGVFCLFLPLQFDGSKWEWQSPVSVSLFVASGVLLSIWVYTQYRLGERATLPFRFLFQRTILSSSIFQCFLGGAFLIPIIYLPLYFQAIRDSSPIKSGVQTLPFIISASIGSFVSGVLVAKIGYLTPIMLTGMALYSIGGGLLSTLSLTTPFARILGFQILSGFGMGLNMQTASVAVQTVVELRDVPLVISLTMFCYQLGTSLFLAICQAILVNKLVTASEVIDPSITKGQIITAGVTGLMKLFSEDKLTSILLAYVAGLKALFIVSTILAMLSVLAAFGVEWKSVKGAGGETEMMKPEQAMQEIGQK